MFPEALGEAARSATGFFWKAGWAFVLGYAISGMIQAFVPKGRLTPYLGGPGTKSVLLATLFGSASSSCSFAALAAGRSLLLKGAHFVATIAFLFASTNLVLELGILILIFLGPAYLGAEILGGFVLIAISTTLARWTFPKEWRDAAREKVEREAHAGEDDFDWRERITSAEGWRLVGRNFVAEWQMVWQEILIGFTVAGFVAVLVPESFWQALFLADKVGEWPAWLLALQNAAVAPFVAAATFIGSMGNIPLATVLDANGVLFAGIMGFIYSDLMVPPLVLINARYYGWRVALYIAGIMFVSIVCTALLLNAAFGALGWIPEGGADIAETTKFALDYTFWLNCGFVLVAAVMVWLSRQGGGGGHDHDHGEDGGLPVKATFSGLALLLLVAGWAVELLG